MNSNPNAKTAKIRDRGPADVVAWTRALRDSVEKSAINQLELSTPGFRVSLFRRDQARPGVPMLAGANSQVQPLSTQASKQLKSPAIGHFYAQHPAISGKVRRSLPCDVTLGTIIGFIKIANGYSPVVASKDMRLDEVIPADGDIVDCATVLFNFSEPAQRAD
ncbi:hypothetical protein AWB82_03281 [Caballeronia glebae]|uniref:Uncharacterized protein n=1 Tax=Caballeronia glebae TaxID=1777143 RepID=A0A158AZH1_9BURK|nr:hypothetical protein [Caballeronia glebae]SAK63212.1 hypothetical protein AWB82_03281 [Caballeronia glebae]